MWGKQPTFENLKLRLRNADPLDGCEPYSFHEPHHATAFLVNGLKKCPLTSMIHNAQMHGAKALFIVNNKDTNVEDIEVPDHLSGVHIHVFIINHSDGQALVDISEQARTEDQNWHIHSKIEIDFLEYARRGEKVKIDMIFSPDNKDAMQFLADAYSSQFAKDIGHKKNIKLSLGYNLMHCDSCKKDGYRLPKEDCLSGGRYCMKSVYYDNLKGQEMLVQVLKNKCVTHILSTEGKEELVGEYYYLLNANCMDIYSAKCTNAVLKKLEIHDKVINCVYDSFDLSAKRHKDLVETSAKPNAMLQENYMLHLERKRFQKIEHYAHFPLLKINEIHYYGPISYYAVFGFICRHINDKFDGCPSVFTEEEITIQHNAKVFQLSLVGIIALLAMITIFACRKQMKNKFDAELSMRVDQSVTEFLQKKVKTDDRDGDEEEREGVQPVEPVHDDDENE